MIHKSKIKAEVKSRFNDVDVVSVDHKKFGVFVVKVKKEMQRSTKIGIIIGETDFDLSENGIVLGKLEWL